MQLPFTLAKLAEEKKDAFEEELLSSLTKFRDASMKQEKSGKHGY